jgi:hypothetical protein
VKVVDGELIKWATEMAQVRLEMARVDSILGGTTFKASDRIDPGLLWETAETRSATTRLFRNPDPTE